MTFLKSRKGEYIYTVLEQTMNILEAIAEELLGLTDIDNTLNSVFDRSLKLIEFLSSSDMDSGSESCIDLDFSSSDVNEEPYPEDKFSDSCESLSVSVCPGGTIRIMCNKPYNSCTQTAK